MKPGAPRGLRTDRSGGAARPATDIMPNIMISCGEASGDLYAGALVRELRRLEPAVHVAGFGGDLLREAGAELVGDFRGLTVTGLVEALGVLPRSWVMYRRLLDEAVRRAPDVFVAIDFPDFNCRVAAALKRRGVPIVYYVSPQIWAWRSGRLRRLKALVDQMLVIFPFEEDIYRQADMHVRFVGHPLVDLARPRQGREAFLGGIGLDPAAPTVALLPGSRPNELRQILPDLVRAAALIGARVPRTQFVLARAPHLDESLFAAFTERGLGSAVVVERQTDDVLAASDIALTASGTATVQAALHGCPMVIVYRLGRLTYRLGKPFVHVDTYGMVNLVAGRRIMPELIQDDFTPDAVAREAIALLTDPGRAAEARAGLREVRDRLGGEGASRRAAEAVLAVAAGSRGTGRRAVN
jgi:lipid-A-disaccharide synthase